MDIRFGATDIFFYSKGEDVNRAVNNINIEEPMLSKKKRSHSSLLSYTEEDNSDYNDHTPPLISCLSCIRSITLSAVRCNIM